MQRDGEEGRKKMTAITRYVTVGLALFESIAMAIGFGRQGMIPNLDFFKGVMFNAKIDILSNEPPVNASKKLNASPALLLNHCYSQRMAGAYRNIFRHNTI